MKKLILFVSASLMLASCSKKEVINPNLIDSANKELKQKAEINYGKEQIKKFIGCYDITFDFQETFPIQNDYKIKDRYSSKALEWIFVIEETEKKVFLQHILVNGMGVIKHWGQEWIYNDPVKLQYLGFNDWENQKISKKDYGYWTQRVTQVDDSPRYECDAPWISWGSEVYWECEADAPLPRRDRTQRDDYNILRRKNRHQHFSWGHLHSHDAIKVIKDKDGSEKHLVMEKGWNTYEKVEDNKCEIAVNWWDEHQSYWNDVRHVWSEISKENNYLKLKKYTKESKLWEELFKLDVEWVEKKKSYDQKQARKEIKDLIKKFMLKKSEADAGVQEKVKY